MIAYTPEDLITGLESLLGEIWKNVVIYGDVYPEPERNKDRNQPYAVILAQNGTYGMGGASCGVFIALAVKGGAANDMSARDCVRWLRDRIQELCLSLYRDCTFHGTIPSGISWNIPESASRPVWEASISITFELPSAAHDNKGFLV